MTRAPAPAGQDRNGGGESRRHFVHVYAVIRVKVAVDATDHRSAMEAADELLFQNGFAVRLTPAGDGIIDADYTSDVAGYLVDEAGDDAFLRSASYGPNHEVERRRP
ncbi:hypothetical protein SAMN06295912_11287 [Sphingomonas laterariae]|uniref:Uncharacterized protein n=1 Tax=Edaphosphingomonas laterariae TaxID=861865 RepID=A0A239GI21_9SPHN|nr:hypothetical protein [Sphingomonas laterariae]SNS68837.1 hypothetical protein SAMN06295912_11287 [Sphingomonas laterariae]